MSDSKSKEDKARDSKRKYDLLAQNIRDVVWTMDLEGRITYVSPSVTAITGYVPEDYYALTLEEFLTPESAARVTAALKDQLSNPPDQRAESFIMELTEKSRAGPDVDIEVNASWMHDADGKTIGIAGISRDITARKRAEKELRESEERFRTLVSSSTEGIIIHENGIIINANQAAADIGGFPNPESLIGKHGLDDVPFTEESRQELRSYLQSSLPVTREAEIVRLDGSHIHLVVQGRATTFQGRPVRIVSFLDVTERYKSEMALRESQEKFLAIGNSALDAMVLINDAGLVEYWNPSAERMFGYTAAEVQGMDVHSRIMPEAFADRFKSAFEGFRLSGTGEVGGRIIELIAKRKDGTEFPIEIAVSPILIQGKHWSSAIIRDITERRNSEKERALNERRLAALLKLNQMAAASTHDLAHFALEEAVSLTGSTIGYIAFANEDESVLTMYAWSESTMAECAVEKRPRVYPLASTGLWGEAVRQRRPIITNDYAADNPLKKGTPQGHVRILRHLNVPIFDGDRIVIVAGVGNKPEHYNEGDVRQLTLLMEGMWRIVTQRRAEEDRKKLQEQLAQSAKMEAVGRLAGGVAHDFNNLLTTVLGYTEMILSQLEEEDPLYTEIEEIHQAGTRAASLTQQLLAFSRKQVIKPRIVELNGAIKEARKMLERLIGDKIKLVLELEPDLGRIKVDPHQIGQVLLNLAVNARDAMPDGGTLTIATSNIAFDKDSLSPHSEIAPGSYVVLSITDTGAGINDEIKSRLFEPFFTTKENGKGTGLGLAMVYGIAKQNGGTISVYSEPGLGTVFRLYLPRTDDQPVASVIPLRIASPTGTETVLLVEDDHMVRRLSQRVLTHLGYEVLQAYDIEDAISICREHPHPIHLLLTDVIMPEMNGVELYAQLRETRSEMKALFMSGYAEDVVVRHGVLPEGTEFIQKPFNMEDLANRVRQTLDGYKG